MTCYIRDSRTHKVLKIQKIQAFKRSADVTRNVCRNLLSCVCRRICCWRVAASENFWSQIEHWNGRCPVWDFTYKSAMQCGRNWESIKEEKNLPEHVGIFFACFGNLGFHFLDNLPKNIRNVLFHHQYGPMWYASSNHYKCWNKMNSLSNDIDG